MERVARRSMARHRHHPQRITGFLRATQPLNDWLITHVDATTLPQRRR